MHRIDVRVAAAQSSDRDIDDTMPWPPRVRMTIILAAATTAWAACWVVAQAIGLALVL